MTPFTKYLATAGGAVNASGDYSTPTAFFAEVGVGDLWEVNALSVNIEDGAGMTTATYGGLGALSNGCTVRVVDVDGSTVLKTLATGIKTNTDWLEVAGDGEILTYTNDLLSLRWEFDQPLTLSAGQQFQVLLSDNMTGIIGQHFTLHGVVYEGVGAAFSRAYVSSLTIPGAVTSGINEDYAVTVKATAGTVDTVHFVINDTASEAAATGNLWEATIATTGAGTFPIHARVTFTDGTVVDAPHESVEVVAQAITDGAVTPTAATAGVAETFYANFLEVGDSVVVSANFSWGDGSEDSLDETPPYQQNHTYAEAGTYTITMRLNFSDATFIDIEEEITVS